MKEGMPINRKLVAKSNYVLREIFQKEDNISFLKDFIESILKIIIKDIYIMPYLERMSKYLPARENFGIVDVRVKTANGDELNIGIQTIDGYYVQNKLLLYYAQIHANQLEYEAITEQAKTITINIVDFDFIKENNEYHNFIKLRAKDGEFLMHTIELNKFRNNIEKIQDKQDGWVAYLASDNFLAYDAIKKYEILERFNEVIENYLLNEKME